MVVAVQGGKRKRGEREEKEGERKRKKEKRGKKIRILNGNYIAVSLCLLSEKSFLKQNTAKTTHALLLRLWELQRDEQTPW